MTQAELAERLGVTYVTGSRWENGQARPNRLAMRALAALAETGTSFFKLLKGTVSAVNKHGIAVEDTRTETSATETYLPFAPDLKLQGLKSVTELQPGDMVLVEYRETQVKDESGQPTKSTRVAVRVSLVTRAPEQTPISEPAKEEPHDKPTVQ